MFLAVRELILGAASVWMTSLGLLSHIRATIIPCKGYCVLRLRPNTGSVRREAERRGRGRERDGREGRECGRDGGREGREGGGERVREREREGSVSVSGGERACERIYQ